MYAASHKMSLLFWLLTNCFSNVYHSAAYVNAQNVPAVVTHRQCSFCCYWRLCCASSNKTFGTGFKDCVYR